jgi:hypothetical protein
MISLPFRGALVAAINSVAFAQVPTPISALPTGFPIPPWIEAKEGNREAWPYDQHSFDLRNPVTQGLLKVPIQGRTWRFVLRSTEARPMGALSLLARYKPMLEEAGWSWQWEERGIAKRVLGESESWLRITPSGGGELKVVLVEKGMPRVLVLPSPGPTPELPSGKDDFPYLPPWPGAKIVASAVSQAPVGLKLPDGKESIAMVNFIDKEYQLSEIPAVAEFLAAYRAALEKAGWEIEGALRGSVPQVQANYIKSGRDIRATLRLSGNALGISVADVGAQVAPPMEKK